MKMYMNYPEQIFSQNNTVSISSSGRQRIIQNPKLRGPEF
jgi:hypothetical protein